MDNFNYKNESSLDPNFITALAKGYFSVYVIKDKRARFKINVNLGYTIKMLEN